MTAMRTELPSSPPVSPEVEVRKSVVKFNLTTFTNSMFRLILLVIAVAIVASGVTYVRTAKVQKCHADHILGFIPAGRTCTIENKF